MSYSFILRDQHSYRNFVSQILNNLDSLLTLSFDFVSLLFADILLEGRNFVTRYPFYLNKGVNVMIDPRK